MPAEAEAGEQLWLSDELTPLRIYLRRLRREHHARENTPEILESKRRKSFARDERRRKRHSKTNRVAECCLYWYPESSGWRQCHRCGNPLNFLP